MEIKEKTTDLGENYQCREYEDHFVIITPINSSILPRIQFRRLIAAHMPMMGKGNSK